MKAIFYPFMVIAACGFVLSVGAHVMALAGIPIPGVNLSRWINVVFIAVMIAAMVAAAQMTRYSPRYAFWRISMAGCPAWMRVGLCVVAGYAMISFMVFMANSTNPAKQQQMSANEVSSAKVRDFSGHLMVFCGMGFALLYSRIHTVEIYKGRECPKGHWALLTDGCCPQCGTVIGGVSENIQR